MANKNPVKFVKKNPVGNPKWNQGLSGNPGGRPKENYTTAMLRAQIAALAPQATEELAKILSGTRGNVRDKISAIRIVYENVLPSLPKQDDPATVAASAMIDAIKEALVGPVSEVSIVQGEAPVAEVVEVEDGE